MTCTPKSPKLLHGRLHIRLIRHDAAVPWQEQVHLHADRVDGDALVLEPLDNAVLRVNVVGMC